MTFLYTKQYGVEAVILARRYSRDLVADAVDHYLHYHVIHIDLLPVPADFAPPILAHFISSVRRYMTVCSHYRFDPPLTIVVVTGDGMLLSYMTVILITRVDTVFTWLPSGVLLYYAAFVDSDGPF